MGFGEIIKRAWHITWRYRALWVLGLFAGVTGGSAGGGSNYRPSSSSSGNGLSTERIARSLDFAGWTDQLARFLPAIVATTLLLVAIGFVLWVVGIAARGGLIQAVDAIEAGHPLTLGTAWDAGFSRFWTLLGLSLLLGLPMALVGLGLVTAIGLSVLGSLRLGVQPGPATVVPLCGVFVVGVPLLIVGGVVLGTMGLLGSRAVMLEGAGVWEAASGAWRTFRTRIKDTLIMWFITLGLNVAASLVIAIPVVIITVATVIPSIFLISARSWPTLIGISTIAVLCVTLLFMLYTAIWGTFTSALWTIFYRRLTGREVPAEPVTPSVPLPPAILDTTEGTTL